MKVKKKLSFFDKLTLWLNGLFCAALLISYLAPSTDPRKFWMPAFFGLGYPFLLLLNVVFLIYWLFRRRLYFLASLICIVLGWNILADNIGLRFGSGSTVVTKPSGAIRVMTYNTHHFRRYGVKADTPTRAEALLLLRQQQPDVIGFQEYFSQKKGRYLFTDSIAKELNLNYHYYRPFTRNRHQNTGMAIFSRYPIVSQGAILLSDTANENQCLYVDIKFNDKVFRFYSVHLRSIGFDAEDYNYLDGVSKKGKPDIHSTKRLGSKLVSAFLKRSEQMYQVKQHSLQCPYPYIISGDFNDTPASFAVNQMSKGLKNAFREKGSGFCRTYNGDFPNFQIDYIMTTKQFDVINYQVIEKKLSDHYPVRSDVVLR